MYGTKAGFLIGLLFVLFSFSTQAAMNRPVTEQGKPTEIQVVGAILDVDKIDSTEQSFTLNLYSAYRWKDPRLAHDGEGSITRSISEIWNPRLTILNTQKHWANTNGEAEISPEGVVTYRWHIFGSFSQPMDLHNFPHDTHVFRVPIVAAGYRTNEVRLVPHPQIDSFVAEKLSVADWKIGNMQGQTLDVTLANDLELPGFVFSFEGRRLVHHYVIKTIIPLSLIVMMSWVVFWIDPDMAANRLSVAVTTVLTLIAFYIALSTQMPKIPYLTNLDKFLSVSTVLVFLALIEVVITSHLSGTGREMAANRIDYTSRWFFPLLFFSALTYSFFI
jgi:gamma-aminobutyric acid receptor subunit beta